VYNALLLFPLLVVLGDTESHDRLCGRYNSHGSGVARLCGHCNTPRSETDNVDYDWDHILPEEVQSVIDAQDRLKGVPKTSSRFIDNLILDKAVSTLSLTHPTSNYEKTVPPLVGAKLTIQMISDENDGLNPEASIVWDKCHRMETSYEPRCLEWLCSNILAELGPNLPIRGCTEHKHTNEKTRGEKSLFFVPTHHGVVVLVPTIGQCFLGLTRMLHQFISPPKLLHS
jgi:hypothetical protein